MSKLVSLKKTIDKSLDKTIYKVKKMVGDNIDTIYVFYGRESKKIKKDELPKDIFTEEETDYIHKNRTKVIFVEQRIHIDDSIATIKIKILNALTDPKFSLKVSLEEIYLFCKKVEKLNTVAVYQTLTQNAKIDLTKIRLAQFIQNINTDLKGNPFPKIKDKAIYSYDDIFEMKLDDNSYIINNVLGQKFFIVENEYPFVCNPFDVNEYDTFFEKNSRASLSTLNNHLLLNSGKLVDNSIYLCLAQDVLSYVESKDISQPTTLKIYYPFIYNKNINSHDDLEKDQPKLIKDNKIFNNENTIASFKTINIFYDVYDSRKTELNYVAKGIKYIKAILKPDFIVKIPLEIIFKIVHATLISPLIKYNQSSKQENIFRLYTDALATNGHKIPYLKKSAIIKLTKEIGRTKSVSIYIETPETKMLNCEFDEEGYITISGEFNELLGVSEINDIFKNSVNPIIQEIKQVLEQSGYKLKLFNSLNEPNIEIKQLTYETQIEIKKTFNLDKYKGCIYSVFINETNALKEKGDNFKLRFKRVSNFNKFTSQEAFVIEKIGQKLSHREIINELVENYPNELTFDQAKELISDLLNEEQLEIGARKSDIKIKDNPGFKIDITVDLKTSILKIVTENINNLNYLNTLPIYLDTLVRLTQDIKSTTYPVVDITKTCGEEAPVNVVFKDISSSTEESIINGEPAEMEEDEDVYYEKKAEDKDKVVIDKGRSAYNILFGDDDDDDDDDNDDDKKSGGEIGGESSSLGSLEKDDSITKETTDDTIKDNDTDDKSVDDKEEDVEKEDVEKGDDIDDKSVDEEDDKSVDEDDKSVDEDDKSVDEEDDKSVDEEDDKSVDEDDKSVDEDDESVDEVRNIDNMKLNNPYYFQTLIQKKDPVLIVNEDTAEFNGYSRTCLSSERRQPVILTDSQLEQINKDHKGFLREQDVIKYGSDKKHEFNYICPRYWCLKTNTIIDPSTLKPVMKNGKPVMNEDGKVQLEHPTCGKVLPKKESIVKPGYYIYEFYGEGEKEKAYPGLITDKHPKGLCLPCCFKKYNTTGRIKAKKSCLNKNNLANDKPANDKPANDKPANDKPENKKPDNDKPANENTYVLDPDKFPLNIGRWGYLPPQIQAILHEINADCYISKTNTNIKEKHPCLLRHGVEVKKNQSFVACMSDVLFFGEKNVDDKTKKTKILNVNEMRERIIKAISVDLFIKYQNGNLVLKFDDPERKVVIDNYQNSELYKKIDKTNADQMIYLNKVVSSFENFTSFLKDDDVIIDHTYLWDIVCIPNKYLFPKGVNLVILQIPNTDITNNVQLVCPTNHYSTEFYEARKPTIILMKEDGYYEPIYSYSTDNGKIRVEKYFREYDPHLSKTMRSVFKELIKPFFEQICKPLDSMPNTYLAKRPLLLYDLVKKLNEYTYKIKKLVMNFNNKIIGVIAEDPQKIDKTGFIPCYPSSLNNKLKIDLDYIFMNDLSIWNNYKDTVQFLNRLTDRSTNKRLKTEPTIPCKPAFKIVEDEHVVGILTNTNQFIQISEPVRVDDINTDLNLPSITDEDYIVNPKSKPNKWIQSDVKIETQTNVDTEREDYIKKLKLETSFYNVFRNTIRILLNDYNNIKIREKIEQEILKNYIIYSDKLANVDALLRQMVETKVQFIGDENYYKLVDNVSTCIVKDKDKCKDTPTLCVVTENGKCNLILPNQNLITNNENEPIYFGRMSDELIRYNRIKSFMLQPQTYLSFSNIGYNLRDNEIILVNSSLTQEYFDSLIPVIANKYVKHNSYDDTQPINAQPYDNTINLVNGFPEKQNELICDKIQKEQITPGIWKNCFPKNYSEIEYSAYDWCTFNFIIDLIQIKTNKKYTINEMKNELYDEYKKYIAKYQSQIIDILIIEGKQTLGDQVSKTLGYKLPKISFADFINTDDYFLTTLDLWLLVDRFEIPTIFISKNVILQTNNTDYHFIGYGNKEDKFAFIVMPILKPEIVPNLKLIKTDKGDAFISLKELTQECNQKIDESFKQKINIETYLQAFVIPKPEKKKIEKKIIIKKAPVINQRAKITSNEHGDEILPDESIMRPTNNITKKRIVIKNQKTKKQKI